MSDPITLPNNHNNTSTAQSNNYAKGRKLKPTMSFDRLQKLKRLEWLTGRARSMSKAGESTCRTINIPSQKRKFLADIFTSLLEVKWRWIMFAFCLLYFGSWTMFAVAWYLILYWHDDLANFENEKWKACVSGIGNFGSAFLFSVETQHTTGYGHYYLSTECPHAMFLMCIQSIVGVILEAFLVGLMFTKMSRAKKRSATLMFSKRAVISRRDGQLCFMFRVGDMRTTCPILDAHVRAQLVKKRTTLEGEVISYHKTELLVHGDEEKNGTILLLWPTIIVHKIDNSSPLKNLSPSDLTVGNTSFEIIVVLEGIVESTGHSVQVRSSYLPHEILWGHRLASLESLTEVQSADERIIDYLLFDNTSHDNEEDRLVSVHSQK